MLRIRSLNVAYGGLHALTDVSLEVERGQFVAVVGPNGAGKTTLFKTISGVVTPVAGEIRYNEHDLLAVPPAERAQLGIAHVPEGRQVFASMTVMENLEMGAYARNGRARWRESLEMILALFPVLGERRTQLAGTLSGGEQQMLAIGRGLASAPELLMLDEPSMGLAPAVIDAIFERVHQIHKQHGLTILLVEQRVAEALESCDRGYVLETGRVVLEGAHDTLMSNSAVRRAYLGM
ncbi:MAG: ABC transporter ATP-binding protein [Xanthobacteraceae bacterium]|nr:ABC transporter ATP-binding protein [Xanthobacteraceae bacterium]PWB65264.1 MAG: branched-chain amino acid ABC transporter ATP-binding protein [Bradyrhizobiaceae bacterium]